MSEDGDIANALRIETTGGVVSVWHARSARNLSEADAILEAIDAALKTTGIPYLLFDSRDADRTPPEIQERIWGWLTEHRSLRRVATVMHSKDLAQNVRETGVGRGIRIKTFADEDAARAWLLSI